MASVSVTGTAWAYNSSWTSFTVGSGQGYTCRQSSSSYRTIVPVKVTPDTGHAVTSFSVTIGLTGSQSTLLAGYLYTSIDTAKSSSGNPAPSGYISSATESGSASNPTESGRNCTLTFTGLNITSATTLYIWTYTTASSGIYQIWTRKSGNINNPTGSVSAQSPFTYTVSYNANGGSGTVPASQTKTYGVTLKLQAFMANYNITGYKVTFNPNSGTTSKTSQTSTRTKKQTYWNTAANGSGTNYASGGSYTSNSAAVLYAIWGTTTNNAVTCPTAAQCTRAGYELLGWSTSSTATTATYAPGASYTPSAAITLYAVWKAKGAVRIWNGSAWQMALPYIYNGSAWQQAIPYVYNGSEWKLGG